MKDSDDYQAGWTKKVLNPKTGKFCSGGAARNMLTAKAGGVVAIQNNAFISGVQYVQPIIESYQEKLKSATDLIEKLLTRAPSSSGLPKQKKK
ncbi:hypothetical protein PCO87_11520 [Pectobacteriaceae bacterium C52]|nr:hypothetical protein PCO87_11520 [Pectobacteriaceae bacterium C52]